MTDLIYCGTAPVGPTDTQALLAGPFTAIWSPPMHRKTSPNRGDRLWLLWKSQSQPAVLLGVGRVVLTSEGRADWTNRTAPGIVEAATALGYRGPTNMAFLRLDGVQALADTPTVQGLGDVKVGLALATPQQLKALQPFAPR